MPPPPGRPSLSVRERRLLVLHGGPGFESGYLRTALLPLAASYQLVGFWQDDPPACIPYATDFEASCREVARLLDEVADQHQVHVLAHSWGVTILLGALALRPQLRATGWLVTPAPSDRSTFNALQTELLSRFPVDLQQRILLADGLTAAEIAELLTYYLAPNSESRVPSIDFDLQSYRHTVESLGNFDVRAALPQVKGCTVILGAQDGLGATHLADVSKSCARVVAIPRAGHFPFIEQPDAFFAAIGHDMITFGIS